MMQSIFRYLEPFTRNSRVTDGWTDERESFKFCT